MALFTVSVFSQLTLPESVRLAIVRLAVDQGRIAGALEALVAKINEPDSEDPQPAIDALVAKLAASNTTLADEVAKILTPPPTQEGV